MSLVTPLPRSLFSPERPLSVRLSPIHFIDFIRSSPSLNFQFQSKSSKYFIHAILPKYQYTKKNSERRHSNCPFISIFLFLSAVWGQHTSERCFFKGEKEKTWPLLCYWDTPNQPPAELHSQTWSVVTFLGVDRERQPTPLAMDFNRHDVQSKTGPVQQAAWVTGQRSMTMRRHQILLHLCSH